MRDVLAPHAVHRLLNYGTATYGYTAHGDLLWKAVGTDTTHYSYDALGNLVQVLLPDGTDIGYLIDAQNRRIGKTVNDTLVRAWLYQGQLTPVAELDGSGNVVSRFVYATGVNVPDYLVRGDSTYRLVRDHLGSVRLVVNVATGTVAQRIDYDAFGIETQNTSPGWQPFGYAGGLVDAQTGLVRFGARDYDPVAGRWTAKDPIGFAAGSTSLYEFNANDPIGNVDYTGRRISLQWHRVGPTPWLHALIRITPENQKKYALDSRFRPSEDGKFILTLGAGPSRDFPPRLVSEINRRSDFEEHPFWFDLVLPPGCDEDALISLLLALDADYRDKRVYDWIPWAGGGYNSNSYAHGLLRAAGISIPASFIPASFPDWDRPLPPSDFGR